MMNLLFGSLLGFGALLKGWGAQGKNAKIEALEELEKQLLDHNHTARHYQALRDAYSEIEADEAFKQQLLEASPIQHSILIYDRLVSRCRKQADELASKIEELSTEVEKELDERIAAERRVIEQRRHAENEGLQKEFETLMTSAGVVPSLAKDLSGFMVDAVKRQEWRR